MFPAAKRIIVIGDVHGDSERVLQALQAARVISPTLEWIASPPETIVVQMGDQIDSANRFTDPNIKADWEIHPDVKLMELMDDLDIIARQKGGRVLSLVGNHELMNIAGEFAYVSEHSLQNSGGPEGRRMDFLPGGKYHSMLLKRYVILKIGNFLFCHAGVLPSHLNIAGENIHEFNTAFWAFMQRQTLPPKQEAIINEAILPINGCLWTRKYAELMMTEQKAALLMNLSIVLRTTQCVTMFVGHSTMENITVTGNGGLVFTDAGFSRSYGTSRFQFIDINDNNMKIVQVMPKSESI
jgi:Calcineurin-like phosphoesterase